MNTQKQKLRKLMVKELRPITVMLLQSVLLFSLVLSAQASDSKGQEYIVESGDSLGKLAERFYGDIFAWPAILEATNDKAKGDVSFKKLDGPKHLDVGQKLWIPGKSEVEHFLAEAEIRGDVSEHGGNEVHWSYEGDAGPEAWGTMDPFYAACAKGKRQSPIDIKSLNLQGLAGISFHYEPSALTILNNGHTIQANYDDGSFIEVDGTRYGLIQFHFHTPSEHTLAGQLSVMEMHLVHESLEGKLAVIGVMVNVGKKNAGLAPVWEHLPTKEGPKQTFDVTINALDLLPAQQQTYRYSGSLTTPPCSEEVRWFVMATPIELSFRQVRAFRQIFKANNRPVQPMNDRKAVLAIP